MLCEIATKYFVTSKTIKGSENSYIFTSSFAHESWKLSKTAKLSKIQQADKDLGQYSFTFPSATDSSGRGQMRQWDKWAAKIIIQQVMAECTTSELFIY